MIQRLSKAAKIGCIGTGYYGVLGFVYLSIVRELPETIAFSVDSSTPATAPEMAVPAIILFAVSALAANGVHGKGTNTGRVDRAQASPFPLWLALLIILSICFYVAFEVVGNVF